MPSVDLLVEGGKATPGPPLGPALGPLGVNVGKVIAEINEKTKSFAGMKVPVKVIVDPKTKSFEIKVGTPTASALILKELGKEKGSGDKKDIAGNLTIEQIIKIAKMKRANSFAKDLKSLAKEIIGTCVSMNVRVENKHGREVIKEIDEGKYDDRFKE